MKIIILEDELPAYEKLVALVGKHIDDFTLLGWARSVAEAKTLLKEHPKPDLIFSDIELLDGHSFEVFESHRVECPIIFSTAFDQYLFQAFKTNGIAYLLKPYTEENFQEALNKYQTLFEQNNPKEIDQSVISELRNIIEGDKKIFKQRFSIKKKSGIKIINIDDIVSFEANGDFSFGYDKNNVKHVINYKLGQIEDKVDPTQFFRINRSEIININYIEGINPHFKNRLAIKLINRAETLYTSSSKTPAFRSWLDS